ncbi:MAG: hypothetical protein EOP88_26080 [Verrucomicrobiaceae bacterium]|nr:MAG: hypothetical protein EOP88_26080 [Verrucomicrobiaceae bacterium]
MQTLKPGEEKRLKFDHVPQGAKLALELENGFDLTKKYRGIIDATVWVSDADTGKRFFGTLMSAAWEMDEAEVLNIAVTNTTQDTVSFSLRLKPPGDR